MNTGERQGRWPPYRSTYVGERQEAYALQPVGKTGESQEANTPTPVGPTGERQGDTALGEYVAAGERQEGMQCPAAGERQEPRGSRSCPRPTPSLTAALPGERQEAPASGKPPATPTRLARDPKSCSSLYPDAGERQEIGAQRTAAGSYPTGERQETVRKRQASECSVILCLQTRDRRANCERSVTLQAPPTKERQHALEPPAMRTRTAKAALLSDTGERQERVSPAPTRCARPERLSPGLSALRGPTLPRTATLVPALRTRKRQRIPEPLVLPAALPERRETG